MKISFLRFVAICTSLAALVVSAQAQDPTLAAAAGDKYVISAKAGGVNYVEGTASVVRKSGKSSRLLKGDTLEIGDRVSTGQDGKIEILLNPGSYLRLGAMSAFEFTTTSLDDLQLRLDSGSAILEVFAADEFTVAVATPKTKFVILETGVYRVDVAGDGARLEVWKGLAKVAGREDMAKGGRAITSSGSGSTVIAKFDRDEKDALDVWSKERGKQLAKLSERLRNRDVRTALMRSYLGRGWNVFGSFGLWVYDPFYGGFVFLPFGRGWYSPYGYNYNCYLGWYNMPPVVWYPPHVPGGGGGANIPTVTPIVSAGTRDPIPPFVRMQEMLGGSVRGRGGDFGGSSYDSSSSYSSSSSSAPAVSAPPPPPPPSSLGTSKADSPTKQP